MGSSKPLVRLSLARTKPTNANISVAVRSGGFYVVSIPTLFIGLQVLYVIMMCVLSVLSSFLLYLEFRGIYEPRALLITSPWSPKKLLRGHVITTY